MCPEEHDTQCFEVNFKHLTGLVSHSRDVMWTMKVHDKLCTQWYQISVLDYQIIDHVFQGYRF